MLSLKGFRRFDFGELFITKGEVIARTSALLFGLNLISLPGTEGSEKA